MNKRLEKINIGFHRRQKQIKIKSLINTNKKIEQAIVWKKYHKKIYPKSENKQKIKKKKWISSSTKNKSK